MEELFWSASIDEVKTGCHKTEHGHQCIICGEEFETGRIYNIDDLLYDAERAAMLHVRERHGSMLFYLLNMNSAFTGLSEVQQEVMMKLSKGLTDKEVALELGVAQSTIRNHRFKLRERERQAKLFLAIMELMSDTTQKGINKMETGVLQDAHKTATTLDDRYNITDKERADAIKAHFNKDGSLRSYPVKEKKKIIVLQEITGHFAQGRKYSEKEINRLLGRIYEDYATLRRALIEYGLLDRTNDGASYWVKE